PHPSSHPFPTRRSSDLRRVALAPRRVAAAVGRLLLVFEMQVRDARVVLLEKCDWVIAGLGVMADVEIRTVVFRGGHHRREALRRDRKSTRLNSSHVSIS